MQIAQLSMKPLADHLAVTYDNRSNERIGTDFPAPTLGKLESSSQMHSVLGCKRGSHID